MQPATQQLKVPTTAIVECPVQETPLGRGMLNAGSDRIHFSVDKLEIVIDYDNVNSFGINGQRVIVFIRNENAAQEEDE